MRQKDVVREVSEKSQMSDDVNVKMMNVMKNVVHGRWNPCHRFHSHLPLEERNRE